MRFEDVYVRYCRRRRATKTTRVAADIRDSVYLGDAAHPDDPVDIRDSVYLGDAAHPDDPEVFPVSAMYMFSHRLFNERHYKMASKYDRIYSARRIGKMLTNAFVSHLMRQTDG